MAALDHVFVCCSVGAPEAEALARLGLREGSPNTHPGQGTANRRFFFGNAYLELLWVADEAEARAEPARSTRLRERWSGRQAGACPFGVVFRPGPRAEDREPPFPTWPYRAPYLPPGFVIEIAVGTPITEPELFYLRFGRSPRDVRREPIEHALPLAEISQVSIGIPALGAPSPSARSAEATGVLSLAPANDYVMGLTFDQGARGKAVDLRPELPLVLRW